MRSVFSPSNLRIVFSADGLLPLVNILAQTEAEDFRFLSPRVALHARPWPEMA
jgi:hypothetical protein